MFGPFAGGVEGGSGTPSDNFRRALALNYVVVARAEHEFIGDDFRPIISVTNGDSRVDEAGRFVVEMQAVRADYAVEDFGLEGVHVVLAESNGVLTGKTFFDHLFIVEHLVAGVLAACGPGKFSGSAEGGEAVGKSVVQRAHEEVHHGVRLEASAREVDLFFRVDFKSAAAHGVVGVDAEELKVENQALGDVRFLNAEAAFVAAKSVGDVRSEDFAKGILGAIEDADVVSVTELEKRRSAQHAELRVLRQTERADLTIWGQFSTERIGIR